MPRQFKQARQFNKLKVTKAAGKLGISQPMLSAWEGDHKSPSIDEIKDYCRQQLDAMWDEMKRFENPQNYYVDLSYDLWKLKHDMIAASEK